MMMMMMITLWCVIRAIHASFVLRLNLITIHEIHSTRVSIIIISFLYMIYMEECSTINDLFSYLQVITHMRTHTVNLWAATVSNAIYGHVDHHHHHHHHLTPHNFNLINRLIFMLNCITRDRERQRELRVQRIKIRLKLLLSFWMN